MAWSVFSATADNLMIKVVKGNELTDIIVEDHSAQEFQTSLANGKDLNKATMVSNQLAILGVRKDYFLLEIPYSKAATSTTDYYGKNALYMDLIEFTSVPPEVQYDVFGEFSPFVTPKIAVDADMIDGIDRQEIGLITGLGFAVHDSGTANVYTSTNKIRGVADSRLSAKYAAADPTAADGTAYLKIKPNDDGVFLIPEGGILWVDPGTGKIADNAA